MDDHDIIRRGLKGLLDAKQGWEVVGEAKTGKEAVAPAEQLKPEIVVMDVSMPDLKESDYRGLRLWQRSAQAWFGRNRNTSTEGFATLFAGISSKAFLLRRQESSPQCHEF